MNTKLYAALFISLVTLNARSMDSLMGAASSSSSSSAEKGFSPIKLIPIHIPSPRNAVGTPYIEEQLDLKDKDLIYRDSFENLMKAKHARNLPYILARLPRQTEDGAWVDYFDAHGLNRVLFGTDPFRNLRALEECKNPASGLPIEWLEYYQCKPNANIFTFMCTYAALRSRDAGKRDFLRNLFNANQDDNLSVAAEATADLGCMYQEGQGVAVDYAKAKELYEHAAVQEDNLDAAATAKNNLGFLYYHGHGVVVDYAKAKELWEQVANQIYDLNCAALAKNNLGVMHYNGHGVAVDYVKAKELFEQVAAQKDNLKAAATAKSNLAEVEALMKKNG